MRRHENEKQKGYVPRALREVWEWKAQIAKEIEGMPLREGLEEILRRAHATAVDMGFYATGPRKHAPSAVRERKGGYSAGRRRKNAKTHTVP